MNHRCEVCGNQYDKPLTIVQDGATRHFDCFECAIHELAPTCAHCSVRILGHGMESAGSMFCSNHCAKAEGVTGLRDRR
jgi:hypothetical protein